ncbi:MAG TPA: glycosyltransferase [Candidatus Paceibacterota bacterium]
MNVISIGSDRNIFKEGSAVRARTRLYGTLVNELHIVVFNTGRTTDDPAFKEEKIAENVWLYPTNSRNRWHYIFDAIRVGKRIIKERNLNQRDSLVTVQDPFESGMVGSALKKTGKVRLHVQIHTDFLSPYFVKHSVLNMMRVMIAGRVLRSADAVRVVSERIKRALIHDVWFKIHDKKITVLPILVDAEKIENEVPSFDLCKKYPEFETIILMASRLEPEKDIATALQAFAAVVNKFPKTGLVIVGSGSELAALERMTHNLRLTNSVRFEGWQENLASYYASADIVLSTSSYEGYGMSLVEAALSGSAIVTTDVGIAGEVFVDAESAFVCGVNDSKCLVGALLELVANKEKRETFAVAAYRAARSHVISKEAYTLRYQESWREALKGNGV